MIFSNDRNSKTSMKSAVYKKVISLILVLAFSVSLIQPWMVISAEAPQRYTALYQNPANKTIKFIVKADGYKYAYAVGEFNNWEKSDNCKLEWKEDPNDNNIWKMMADVYVGDLATGDYKYKFILIKEDGSEEWINQSGYDGDDSSFHWEKEEPVAPSSSLKIKTSRDTVSANCPVDVIALTTDEYANIKIENDANLELSQDVPGARIENHQLWVSEDVADGTTIEIKATAGTEFTTKTVTVSQNETNGTLVHFLKQDGNYDQWNYWSFGQGGNGTPVNFDEDTDLGKAAFLTKDRVIVRKGDWQEETPTYEVPLDQKNAYIIKDDPNLYTSLESAVLAARPKITTAIMDSKESITAYLSEKPRAGINFALYIDDVKQENVQATVYEDDKKVVFDTSSIADTLDTAALLEVKADNMFTMPTTVVMRNVLDSFYYDGNDMGATYTDSQINLRLWAPTAHKVEVLTYNSVEQAVEDPTATYPMSFANGDGTHYITIDRGANYNQYYMYRLHFKMRDTEGKIVDRITYAVDPYANAVGTDGAKGVLLDINDPETIPAGWEKTDRPELVHPEDSIIYEMHVRDFTIDSDWGGKSEHAGKYLGVVEEGTTYKDANGKTVTTGLDHLKELGVTHVHLLPTYDIASVEETGDLGFGGLKENGEPNRNWGYDPKHYNVPEGSYSTDPTNPKTRILEFRQMVQGMHKNNIRVVLDQVYNHMYSVDNMNNIVPGYYFRSWPNGSKSNGSGCGNEVASERPMVRKFIVDSNLHWIKDYKVDGLRFDLMALLDQETMNEVKTEAQKLDPSIIVYGEPWAAAASPLPGDQQTTKNKGIAAFNDVYRNALRGDNNPGKGFINGGISEQSSGEVQEGIRGSTGSLVNDPEYIINYVEAHDNYSIWDQVEKSETGVENGKFREGISEDALSDWRVKKTILGSGLVLTSQGIPFFQGGSEILRTKQGDHNSYKSNDEINDIDWADKAEYEEVFNYYKGLIQLRKEHPAFRMTSKDQIQSHQKVYRLNYDDEIILQYLMDHANGDTWKNILVIYNGSMNEKAITWLPQSTSGKWNVVADYTGVNLKTPIKVITQNGDTVDFKISPNSMMVLYDQEGAKEDIQWDYLFADQSVDYMEPMEPKSTDDVKVRFRAKAGEITEAYVHYYDEATRETRQVEMSKITDDAFYDGKGYDKSKIEFWEGVIPAGASTKYYNFEVKNTAASPVKTAWISGGAGGNNRGVTETAPKFDPSNPKSGIDYGFSIVPDYSTPKWSKESVFYQIMVDRFRDGDSSNNRVAKDVSQFGNPSEIGAWNGEIFNGTESDMIWNNQFFGGDLIGVNEAIPYLKDVLGVDALYLMPIFQSGSDHKYDADTYEFVDKNFGGNQALVELSSALDQNNMNLILDGVFNHTSVEGDLFQKFKDRYYFYDEGKYVDKSGIAIDFYPWHGYTNLAKLNYSNEDLKMYIYGAENSIAKRYMRPPYNIDGWRLDAAEDVNVAPRDYKYDPQLDINAKQTDEQQREANLKIWQEFRSAVRDVKEDAFVLGEFWGNDNQWYYGKAWDSKMNYGGFMMPFIENRSANSWLGNQSLDNKTNEDGKLMSVADIGIFTRNYFKGFPYQTILNSTNSISTHDKQRFLNWDYVGPDNNAMMELAIALQMTYPGIPMIYYGDEIGMVGKGEGKDPYNRATFDWNLDNWNTEMLDDYRTLIATRKKNQDAFVYGAFEEIKSHRDDQYIAYARYGNQNKAITILNNSDKNASKTITLDRLERYGFKDGDVLKDVMSGNTVTVRNGQVVVNSKDMSASVYVLQDKAVEIEPVSALNLNDYDDSRIQLPAVQNPKYRVENGKLHVTWDTYKQEGSRDILVRIYDGDKVVQETKVLATAKSATLDLLKDNLEGYTVSVKVEADRSIKRVVANGYEIDDVYADSVYVNVTDIDDGSGGGGNTETTETTEATESTESTEGTQSTESTESTEGTQSTESTESTEATQSTESTESTEATQGTESTESTEATQGTESTESTEATQSTESTESTEATQSTESTESTEGTLSTETAQNTESTQNTGSTDNTEKAPDQGSPHTGDNSVFMLVTMFTASVICLAVVYGKKHRL